MVKGFLLSDLKGKRLDKIEAKMVDELDGDRTSHFPVQFAENERDAANGTLVVVAFFHDISQELDDFRV